MTPTLIQDALVTGIALIAAVFAVRRVVRFLGPRKAGGGCASCATGHPCATSPNSGGVANDAPVPVELLRSQKRS